MPNLITGRLVIDAFLRHISSTSITEIIIIIKNKTIALSRKPDNPATQILSAKPDVTITQGVPNNLPAVIEQTGPFEGAFLVSVAATFHPAAEDERCLPTLDICFMYG